MNFRLILTLSRGISNLFICAFLSCDHIPACLAIARKAPGITYMLRDRLHASGILPFILRREDTCQLLELLRKIAVIGIADYVTNCGYFHIL